MASQHNDRKIRIWDLTEGEVIKRLQTDERAYEIAWHPNGNELVVARHDGDAEFWDLRSGEVAWVIPTRGRGLIAVALSRDGVMCATTYARGGAVEIWNTESRRRVAELSGHGNSAWYAAFNADGTKVLTTAKDNVLRVWSLPSGTLHAKLQVLPKSRSSIHRWVAEFSPDGTQIALGLHDGSVRMLRADSLKTLREIAGHSSYVWALRFDPTGRMLATASWDRTLRVFDVATGAEQFVGLGHRHRLLAVIWNGRQLITGSDDGTVKCWDPYSVATAELRSDPHGIGKLRSALAAICSQDAVG